MMTILATIAILFLTGVICFTIYLGWYMYGSRKRIEQFKRGVLQAKGYSDHEIENMVVDPDASCRGSSVKVAHNR